MWLVRMARVSSYGTLGVVYFDFAKAFGPSCFFINDFPNVINVTTLLFVDEVKMVSPRSQSDLLQGFLYNLWSW